MTIEELIIYGKKYIHSIEAKMLLASVTGYDQLNLLFLSDDKLYVIELNQLLYLK